MITGHIICQRLNLCDSHVVADTLDYLEAKFIFRTDDWVGLDKWVHFANSDGTVYDIRLTDDCIRKEDHLNLSAGMWKVYLHGNEFRDSKVIQRITTDAVPLYVNPTGMLGGEPFPTVPPSAGEQIVASAQAAESSAKNAAERAETAAGAAGESADTAETAANTAVAAENDAAGAAKSAAESEKNAAGSAMAAEQSADRAEQAATGNGYIEFELNNDDGILYLHRTDNLVDEMNFELDEETGELEVIIE